MEDKEEYYGVYDLKESDTFRPTLDKRIHKNYPYSKTLTTREDSCCVMFEISGGGKKLMVENEEVKLRIRKLTQNECLRLMGLRDSDIKLISEHQTKATLYHLAGDSIVCQVLMALMCSFFDKNWEDYFKPEDMWKNE